MNLFQESFYVISNLQDFMEEDFLELSCESGKNWA